jgi:SAM-dependent methyltransferase
MSYLFGDSDIAARRLKVVAEVFAEPTREFLIDAVGDASGLALDLGCGPGYSTHLLADVLQCDDTVGLDKSEHFISLARKTATENVAFHLHDVTSIPFPVGPSNLIFCRFLLTHLTNARALAAKWATQLRPNGLMMIQEVDGIETDNAVFATYLRIIEDMLADQSTELYVGRTLDDLEDDRLKKRMSRVTRLQVTNRQAATMFFMNMQSWKNNPFVRAQYPPKIIRNLDDNLHALMQEQSNAMEIEWGLREVAYERI